MPAKTASTNSHALRPLLFIFTCVLAVAAVVTVSKVRMPPELVPWRSDFAAARSEAAAAGKPLLIYFTADWCPPCHEMRRRVFSDADVAAAAARYVPVRIDVDRQPDLAMQFEANTMPMFVLMTSDGQIGKKFVGGMESDEFRAWLGSK